MSTPMAKSLCPNTLAVAHRATTNDNGHYRRCPKHPDLRAKPLGHSVLKVGLMWAYYPPLARPGRFDGRTDATPCNIGRLRHRPPTRARGPFRVSTGTGPGLWAGCNRAGGGHLICPGLYFSLDLRVKGLYYSSQAQLTRLIAPAVSTTTTTTRKGFLMQPIHALALIAVTVLIGVGGSLLLLDCLNDVLTDWARYKRNRDHKRNRADIHTRYFNHNR